MAKVAIRFAESALADLESIRAWYAEQDVPEVGERLIGEIVASIEALAEHPDMGRIVPEFDQPVLRELIRPPFRIVYRRDPKHVRVVRVWRSERLLDVPDEDTHVLRVTPIDDAKQRPDQLAQKGLVELGDDPPHVRMFGECLDARDDFLDQALAHLGHVLFGVPGPYRLQIGHCRFGNPDGDLRHAVTSSRAEPWRLRATALGRPRRRRGRQRPRA